MTKAYLVKLAGMGDHQWTLLDQDAWSFLEACCDWQRGRPLPVPSEALITDIMESYKCDREEALEILTLNPDSSTYDNDIAMSLQGSLFGGERFYSFSASIKELNAFVTKHGLDMEEVYDGYLY